MATRFSKLMVCALVGATGGCGGGGSSAASDTSNTLAPTSAPSATTNRTASPIEGAFPVRGHRLYLSCHGSAAPTVVYLHGFGGSSANAGLVPGLLDARHRVCVYDRANVGRSGAVPGPLTGEEHVADLRALLTTARVPGPYVLLGASFGGLIADMYAATYPRDVAGMVLLDASLPSDPAIDKRFLPRSEHLKPDDWKGTTESLDRFATYRQARAIAGRAPQIPVTYLAADPLDVPPSWPVKRLTAAIRRAQRAFVSHFSPGRLVIVEAPHYMEPVIPERIAREVLRVVEATRKG